MAVIKWRDSYNTGVGIMDKEHKQLVDLIETMHEAIRDGATIETVGKVLTEMAEYTDVHFRTEEKLMEEYNYPDIDSHKKEHKKLIKEAESFSKKLAEHYPDGLQEFYKFLREWLVNHILDVDKKLGEFLLHPDR